MSIPTTLKPTELDLFDKAIAPVQDALKANLTWLNYSFGKMQKLTKQKGRRSYQYPGVYYTNNEYLDLLPNDEFGNFSFFILDPSNEIELNNYNEVNRMKAPVSIVFWVNLDQVYGEPNRSVESLKIDILRVLLEDIKLTDSRLTVTKVEDQAEDIYREFSIKETDSQFLMKPYAGLRFSGTLDLTNVFCSA